MEDVTLYSVYPVPTNAQSKVRQKNENLGILEFGSFSESQRPCSKVMEKVNIIVLGFFLTSRSRRRTFPTVHLLRMSGCK